MSLFILTGGELLFEGVIDTMGGVNPGGSGKVGRCKESLLGDLLGAEGLLLFLFVDS